jgi:plastocyanin
VLPAAPAGSHVGHGPTFVAVGGLRFAPAAVTVLQGDTVVWTYGPTDRNHTVTADDGSFDSATDFSVRFDTVGTFGYHCKVHSFMKGTVVVDPAPDAPTLPVLSGVRLRVAGARGTLRFTVDQAASVRALVRRGGRTVRESTFAAKAGASTRQISLRRLKAGAYQLKVVAIDDSTGLSSKAKRVSFRVKR